LGGNEAAVIDATTNEYPHRQSIICCNYDPPILTFDSSDDWTAITGPRGQHFAIGIDSFDKNCEYCTKNNSPGDVFSALTFMMLASLEHHSVINANSSLIDTLFVNIKRSSFPKDERTPEFIHPNCFGKPSSSAVSSLNTLLCHFTLIIGVNTQWLLVLLHTTW